MCYAHFRNVFSYMLVGSVRIVVTVLVAAMLCEGVARKNRFFIGGGCIEFGPICLQYRF